MFKLLTGVSLALGLGMFAQPAAAAILVDEPAVSDYRSTPSAYTYLFEATEAGAGTLDFTLLGRGSIDGQGAVCGSFACDDTFYVILNGSDIFEGKFRLGGLGTDVIFSSPAGATFTVTSGAFGEGGSVAAFLPIQLRAGLNSLTFNYVGRDQGQDDESWALSNVLVRDSLTAGVPEPATWALMIAGFGLTGAVLRRRQPATSVSRS